MTGATPNGRTARVPWAALVLAVVALGAVLRIVGMHFGLPFLYDPDEPDFVERAFSLLANRDLNPHWFGHPGSFTIYSLAGAFALYGGSGLLTGRFADAASIGHAFWSEPSSFYLLARAVIVAFGVGTLAVLYALGRRVTTPAIAVLATALLAFAPLHVEFSKIVRTDVQQTFLLVVMTYFAVRAAATGAWRHYGLAGAFLGMAVATKYPSVVACLTIAIAWLIDARRQRAGLVPRFPRLAFAAFATLLGAFATAPYLFLDLHTVLHDVATEARTEHLSATSPGFLGALVFYLGVLADQVTVPGLLLAALGIASAARRTPARAALLFLPPAAYLVFIASLHLMWTRWTVPLLPFLALAAALGFGAVATAIATWLPPRIGRVVAAVLLLAWIAVPLATSVTEARIYASRRDARTSAFEWIEQNVPKGSRLLMERYTPQLRTGDFEVFLVRDGQIVPRPPPTRRFELPTGVIGELRDVQQIGAMKIAYVVIGDDVDRRLADYGPGTPTVVPYEAIARMGELVFAAEPRPGVSMGNAVRVYRMKRAIPAE